MLKVSLASMLVVVAAFGAVAFAASCDRDLRRGNVTDTEVEYETRRAIERGETFVERKTERTADAIRDKLDRLTAREHEVRNLREDRKPISARGVRDEFDDAMDAVDAKSKQLEARFEDLKRRAAAAGEDAKEEMREEWVQLEAELDQLQRSLGDMEHEIRAEKR